MKFIRGSISSLYGMSIRRNLNNSSNIEIIRPLLAVSREEIKNYISKNNIYYRQDKSNNNLDFTRNRIRIEVIPKIIQENKNLLSTIFYKSEVINNENKYLDKLSHSYLNECLLKKDDNHIILSKKNFNKIPEELKLRVIKNTFILLKNNNFSFDFKTISAVNNCIIKNESNKLIKAKNNFFFIKDRDYLIFTKDDNILKKVEFEYKIIEEVIIKELNLKIKLYNNKEEFVVKNYLEKEKFKNKTLKNFFDKKRIPEYERVRTFLLFYKNEIIYIHNFYNKENLEIEVELI
ncbi:MAG: hypothetical protein KatS3mg068_0223 [Candidatus Sericytochromatia bacterium]|nr:MAG: hypothetical protein KatS3mg068_0223 [Candidatus Sericytochromatia bacterium]